MEPEKKAIPQGRALKRQEVLAALEQGHQPEDVAILMEERQGWDLAEARALVAEAQDLLEKRRAKSRREMLPALVFRMAVGAVLFVLGSGMTAYSYLVAKPGGTYLIAYGFIIGGPIIFFHAWDLFKKGSGAPPS